MNYKTSYKILELIKNAKNILLALHISPDMDSLGSNLAMYQVLKKLGLKKVDIYSADILPPNFDFLPLSKIIIHKDVGREDLSLYDLFITLDSADKLRVTRINKDYQIPVKTKVVNIDHHKSNPKYGNINIIDSTVCSTGELLYLIFEDWGIKINSNTATCLLSAMCGDTGTFRYPSTSSQTLEIAGKLIKSGAEYKKINFNLYQRTPFSVLRYLSFIFGKLEIIKEGNTSFSWVTISKDELKLLGGPEVSRGASDFLGTIDETDFGVLIKEEEKGLVSGSLRGRLNINVAKIAQIFNGDGHINAAGFRLNHKNSFEVAKKEILIKIKKHLKNEIS